MSANMSSLQRKHSGAYYTPDSIARTLVSWSAHQESDRLLDPSCGDGRFIAAHSNSVGIEQDPHSAQLSIKAAPSALVHEGDFFTWAAATAERFECAAGNPPFIRYQTFNGDVQRRALELCRRLGAHFNNLCSSWAPFIVAVTGVLKPEGRMAFIVPAEIGHAPYAAPVLEHLVSHFRRVQIIAVREKLFPDLSEDCWLLYAEGFGGRTDSIDVTISKNFQQTRHPPKPTLKIAVEEWRSVWNRRLRSILLPRDARDFYKKVACDPLSFRLTQAASTGIGYVSGANDFFHFRPSQAARWCIPEQFLLPSVRNGRVLPEHTLTNASIAAWHAADEPIYLLRLPKTGAIPAAVKPYLESDRGREARQSFKCRVRSPWWSVPDVKIPDFFLSYMSGVSPNLVRNIGGATCTNSVHAVITKDAIKINRVTELWETPFVQLSCELEGHPLGGGMLKLEPREAGRVLFPSPATHAAVRPEVVEEALSIMRCWRHYG